MNKEGVACSLLTGQRVVTDPTAHHLACTVEMADVARYARLLAPLAKEVILVLQGKTPHHQLFAS
jgi:hypothetical protein